MAAPEGTPEMISPLSDLLVRKSLEEVASTIVSRLFFKSNQSLPLNQILLNVHVPGDVISQDDLKEYKREDVEGRLNKLRNSFPLDRLPRGNKSLFENNFAKFKSDLMKQVLSKDFDEKLHARLKELGIVR